jgi:general stress protein YciG
MPHEGPYINDLPASPTKKAPAIVEELGAKKTSVSSSKPSNKEETVLDGDKSVMQDPERKLATGNKGTEGGVSAKDKERLAHEGKTGEKLEKVPEPPKEAPPLPHSEQKQLHGEVLGVETSTRALGAVGLEVSSSST